MPSELTDLRESRDGAIAVEDLRQISENGRMDGYSNSTTDLHEYFHALWFRVLTDAPQGMVLELCRQANLNNAEIQSVAQFRSILRQQRLELEQLKEAINESERVLTDPTVARASAAARQMMEHQRPSIMHRLGRLVGKLKSRR